MAEHADLTQDLFPNAPELEESAGGFVGEPAIVDADHAWEVCEQIFDDAENNIKVAAKIREKIDGIVPPYDPKLLREEGKGHVSNIPMGILRTTLAKIPPVFYDLLLRARFLINNYLPDQIPGTDQRINNAHEKSEHIMKVFTDTLKRWPRFYPFVVGLAEEYSRGGHCYTGFLNEIDWQPRMWRLDDAQVPRGTEIMADDIPGFAVKVDYYVHDLFDEIRDKEAAEADGWNIEAVVDAINEAREVDHREEEQKVAGLDYMDMARELTPASSYLKGTKRVKTYHLFQKEYDGAISHFIVLREDKTNLFEARNRFPAMRDVCVPFAFEWGDGTIHGAKSPGHTLYDLAVGADKALNSLVDNLRNRGRFFRKFADEASYARGKVIINDECVDLIGGEPIGSNMSLPDTTGAGANIYELFQMIIGENIGAFLPPTMDNTTRNIGGEAPTATQVSVAAQRQAEYRQSILEWFLKQWGMLSLAVARRLFNPNSLDEDAARARDEVLRKVTEQELQLWLSQLPVSSIADFTDLKNQKIAAVAQAWLGDPDFNQRKLKASILTATLGSSFVDEWIIPPEDQSIVQEAARQQQIELGELREGRSVAVVPRDNDMIHIQILRGTPENQFVDGALVAILNEGNEEAVQATYDHYAQHVTQADSKGILGEQQNVEKQFAAQFKKLYDEKFMVDQQAAPVSMGA